MVTVIMITDPVSITDYDYYQPYFLSPITIVNPIFHPLYFTLICLFSSCDTIKVRLVFHGLFVCPAALSSWHDHIEVRVGRLVDKSMDSVFKASLVETSR